MATLGVAMRTGYGSLALPDVVIVRPVESPVKPAFESTATPTPLERFTVTLVTLALVTSGGSSGDLSTSDAPWSKFVDDEPPPPSSVTLAMVSVPISKTAICAPRIRSRCG